MHSAPPPTLVDGKARPYRTPAAEAAAQIASSTMEELIQQASPSARWLEEPGPACAYTTGRGGETIVKLRVSQRDVGVPSAAVAGS